MDAGDDQIDLLVNFLRRKYVRRLPRRGVNLRKSRKPSKTNFGDLRKSRKPILGIPSTHYPFSKSNPADNHVG